jgi:hypothetical protein
MTHKNRKKSRIFMFLSPGYSLLRAEAYKFFANFRSSNPGSGSAITKNAGSESGSALNQCGSETMLYFQYDVENYLSAES